MQWLDIRLQLIGVAVVSGLAAIAVIQHQYGSVDPGESTAELAVSCRAGSGFLLTSVVTAAPPRPGGSVPVLLPVHHHPAVWTHIQLHPDGDAAGECGED